MHVAHGTNLETPVTVNSLTASGSSVRRTAASAVLYLIEARVR